MSSDWRPSSAVNYMTDKFYELSICHQNRYVVITYADIFTFIKLETRPILPTLRNKVQQAHKTKAICLQSIGQ